MSVKKTPSAPAPPARRLVELSSTHLDHLLDSARVEHWTRELLKFGTKPDELRRAIVALEVVTQLRETDLEIQRELAMELRANSDAILFVAGPDLQASALCLTGFNRPVLLSMKPQVFFEGVHANTAWLSGLLQHLLREGYRLGAVIGKYGPASPLVEAAQENLEEVISIRHGAEEARRRIVLLNEVNSPGREPYRKIACPERLAPPLALFSAIGCMPLLLAGLDAFQFAEGARSLCRALEKSYNAEDPCVRFTATRLHLLAEKSLRELFLTPDPGLDRLGLWWETLMEPSSVALGSPAPGSLARPAFDTRVAPTEPTSEFGITLAWEEDDSPGQLLELGHLPHLSLQVRKRDAFSLGAACAFLACSASMTHRLINLPFAR